MEIAIGRAADVRIRTSGVTASTTSGSGDSKRVQSTVAVTIENDKPIAISFELYQDLSQTGARIVSASQPITA